MDSLEQALTHALREISGPTWIAAAERLDNRDAGGTHFNFHVYGGGGDSSGAVKITNALKSVSPEVGAMLASFKLSCNTDFGDAGAIALASALPPILRDLGLVGFKIGGLGEHDQH